MNHHQKIFFQIILVFFLLGNYSGICCLVDFAHDHESDIQFHENCPACQWQTQIQDDHSEYETILKYFLNAYNDSGQEIHQENLSFQNQIENNYYFSRAPPSSD